MTFDIYQGHKIKVQGSKTMSVFSHTLFMFVDLYIYLSFSLIMLQIHLFLVSVF
jgi:hypothetical protein